MTQFLWAAVHHRGLADVSRAGEAPSVSHHATSLSPQHMSCCIQSPSLCAPGTTLIVFHFSRLANVDFILTLTRGLVCYRGPPDISAVWCRCDPDVDHTKRETFNRVIAQFFYQFGSKVWISGIQGDLSALFSNSLLSICVQQKLFESSAHAFKDFHLCLDILFLFYFFAFPWFIVQSFSAAKSGSGSEQ